MIRGNPAGCRLNLQAGDHMLFCALAAMVGPGGETPKGRRVKRLIGCHTIGACR